MALAFKPGDSVVQNIKPIEGTVVDAKIIDGDVQFVVAYMGDDGEPHERTFAEGDIRKAE